MDTESKNGDLFSFCSGDVVRMLPSLLKRLYEVLLKPLLIVWRKKLSSSILNFHIVGPTKNQGGCSTVYVAHDREFDLPVALKVVPFKKSFARKQFQNEARITKRLSGSPHIVHIYNTFIESNHGFIAMEMADTDLHEKYLGRQLDLKLLKQIFLQICLAVQSCHQNNVAHLDIKPENILIDRAGNIKLCDFGSAVMVTSVPDYLPQIDLGSDFYSAPEVHTKPVQVGLEADMWSLGVLLYAFVCGTFPYDGENECEMMENYRQGNVSFSHLEYAKISPVGKNLIRLLLKPLPQHRLTISQTLNHPWFHE